MCTAGGRECAQLLLWAATPTHACGGLIPVLGLTEGTCSTVEGLVNAEIDPSSPVFVCAIDGRSHVATAHMGM
jgi:hypothetical protein